MLFWSLSESCPKLLKWSLKILIPIFDPQREYLSMCDKVMASVIRYSPHRLTHRLFQVSLERGRWRRRRPSAVSALLSCAAALAGT